MLHIDVKYVLIAGQNLNNFKQKNDYLFNCSCPFPSCVHDPSKIKGYFFKVEDAMRFWCHKCRASHSIGNFLKEIAPSLYEKYLFDKFSGKRTFRTKTKVLPVAKVEIKKKTCFATMTAIRDLPDIHFAKQYVLERKLPEFTHSLLFYTNNFAECVEEIFPRRYTSFKTDQRLVIPFYDNNHYIQILQGRALRSHMRYLTAKLEDNLPLVYGLERLDRTKKIYVVEGPIDSLFLPNCLAVAGADLKSIVSRVPNLANVVCILDNEPRNDNIVQALDMTIESGANVFIWPRSIKEKDINDLILNGKTTEQVVDMIEQNTYSGIRAKLEFGTWKKRPGAK